MSSTEFIESPPRTKCVGKPLVTSSSMAVLLWLLDSEMETLHPSKRRPINIALRTSVFAGVRCVWRIICTINKALYILEKPHRKSVLFALYPDCSLKVSVHPEDPATGHLATVFSWFYCLDANPKAVSKFEVVTTCFPFSRPDLNSSHSNPVLKVNQSHYRPGVAHRFPGS
jgi:hypothetical protein